MSTTPTMHEFRNWQKDAAIVFLHGFSGEVRKTWGDFPLFLLGEESLSSWDIFAIGYPTGLIINISWGWAANPDLHKLSVGLAATLNLSPFYRYKALAIVAHSMGGLIVQRTLLDNPGLVERIRHVLLFGTPSNGLEKAWFARPFNCQVADMAEKGKFIVKLRRDWNNTFSLKCPFSFAAITGDRDEFVPALPSLNLFPGFHDVVPGNHLEIVKPETRNEKSVSIVVSTLTGGPLALDVIDSARLAVEMGHFQQVIDGLLPHAKDIDDRALGDLALALDGLGRGDEALTILEQRYHAGSSNISTDTMGILAGRVKRRWLITRQKKDWKRAHQIYGAALKLAEVANAHEQVYYHAINVAFLKLMQTSENVAMPKSAKDMATKALKHCALAKDDYWRKATEAEASLILGHVDTAIVNYRDAIDRARSPREVYSMYSQAVLTARRVGGEDTAQRVGELFSR